MIKDCHNAHTYEGWFCKLDNLSACCICMYYPGVFLKQAAQTVSILYECRSPHSIYHEAMERPGSLRAAA